MSEEWYKVFADAALENGDIDGFFEAASHVNGENVIDDDQMSLPLDYVDFNAAEAP